MTDVRQPFFWRSPPEAGGTGGELTVVTLEYAARYLRDDPPDADVVILESADALSPYRVQIDELAAASADTNSQFEYVTLSAAMEHLRGGETVRVALLWSDADENGKRVLTGLVPYRVSSGFFGLPKPVWRVWRHIHSYISTPVLRSGHERLALRRFLTLADMSGAAFVEFPIFHAGSAFADALEDVAGRQGRHVAETNAHERAFLQSDLSGDAYLSAHIRKKKRKEFNRLWNRLAELGELRFEAHDGGTNPSSWIRLFLDLEARGWKGKRGTALKADPGQRAFFEKICRGAHAQGKLHCAELTLDGKPLAMLASFRASGGVYTFKIAFDEDYSRYSPGALLMLKATGAFLGDERSIWVDSCAVPNHPMIDHIWAQRRAMRSVLVSCASPFGVPSVRYAAAAMTFAETVRTKLRARYHAFRKGTEHDAAD
ncbi:GNAT family N-acetyltransferase [Parvibaculum sp.]|jgi:hypothetical protein|uniref:GNAT family N-acetyltransferase n=1 Tax=Parvibaculum sp. TaxID=2024848 RepID=UPI001B07B1BB|nr:GNAT family N-acetyltransferase [Parvibaculum sp.]MBO6635391.1 GNAT family N-acetyltransferase [Parvibaculum sp.]MBO6680320.1 GNAT family N-acetyltransferase [Parvibaculum sp.]MBO6686031.1 GNAT family N-acetyltransferase [Parvibaculum sp.]MBO6903864.1 GNAT family N-acetyltransferase [Parvibaculum sp.]